MAEEERAQMSSGSGDFAHYSSLTPTDTSPKRSAPFDLADLKLVRGYFRYWSLRHSDTYTEIFHQMAKTNYNHDSSTFSCND